MHILFADHDDGPDTALVIPLVASLDCETDLAGYLHGKGAPGYGDRLLDRFVADSVEPAQRLSAEGQAA